MIVGAYRENEVNRSHHLIHTIDEIKSTADRKSLNVNTIFLQPLGIEDINQLVADSLEYKIEKSKHLGELVYQKTGGNPFFVKQFLRSLHEEGLLVFDQHCGWKLDLEKINQRQVTDNVLGLLVSKIARLFSNTQEMLKLAACIGNEFNPEILAIASEKSLEETFVCTHEAIKEGLVSISDKNYFFSHDRIRDAAYSLIPDDSKCALHLKIGNLLLKQTREEELREKVFNIVDQLNFGIKLISEKDKRYELARLNLMAGMRAKSSAAYDQALRYLTTSMGLLNKNSWHEQYSLTFSISMERSECEYLCHNFAKAEKLFDETLKNVKTDVEKANVYIIKMVLYINQGKHNDAIELGLKGLKLFGIVLQDSASKIVIIKENLKIKLNLLGKKIEDLTFLPNMTDRNKRTAMSILVIMCAPSFFISRELYFMISLKMIHISLKEGNTDASSGAYVTYGMILSGLGYFESGRQFGKLSLRLCENYNNIALTGKCNCIYGALINHWNEHIKSSIEYLVKSFRYCIESGELVFAGYSATAVIYCMSISGCNLDDIFDKCQGYLNFVMQIKDQETANSLVVTQQMILNLKGMTRNSFSYSSNNYDEDKHREQMNESIMKVPLTWYYIVKLRTLYLFGKYDDAIKIAMKSYKILDTSFAFPQVPEHYFYYSLTLTAIYSDIDAKNKCIYWKTLKKNQKNMKRWADNCPENFLHKYLLVAAEMARIKGRDGDAIELYDQAIKSAGENEYIQNEAIGNELAARFYFTKGKDKVAKTYMKEARNGYYRWGAMAKVNDLEQKLSAFYQDMPITDYEVESATRVLPTKIISSNLTEMDLLTISKVAQILFGEIILDKLLRKLMQIVIENAGAQRGLLILEKEGKLVIEAEGTVGDNDIKIHKSIPVESVDIIASSVINYVKRKIDNIVINDAMGSSMFKTDPYVIKNHPRSILCAPIVKQTKLVGILYLENNLTTNAFSKERLEVLKLICVQAAISLENARLYNEISSREKEIRHITESNLDAIFAFVKSGELLYVSPSINQITGYKPDEVIGYSFTKFVPEYELPRCWDILENIFLGNKVQSFETILKHKNGNLIPIEISAQLVNRDGEFVGQGAIRNITDRKLAEAENMRLAIAVESTGEAIAITDTKAIILYVNPAFEKISGYKREESIGKSMRLLKSGKQDHLFYHDIWDTIASGKVWKGRMINKKKDGTLFHDETTISPIKDSSGMIVNYVAVKRDITKEIALEAQVRQSQKLEAIGRLAGGIAHDFNNILSSIIGYSEMAKDDLPEGSQTREDIEEVFKAGYRAKKLVQQILTFSRQSKRERKPLQIASVVKEALKLMRSSLPTTIEISQDISAKCGTILADPTQIHQVVINLCTNAGYAMGDKGGKLTVNLAGVEIDTDFAANEGIQHGSYVRLTVADTGCGMEAEVMERIFDPFFTTKPIGKGTGMGLSAVHGIVEEYGGKINVSSKHGKGTKFNIFLPVVKSTPVLIEDTLTGSTPKGVGRILFVDDEEGIVNMSQKMLKRLGYDVVGETSSIIALAIFRTYPNSFDIVITDQTMPKMTGDVLAREILRIRPDIPIILCTGFSETFSPGKVKELGISDHLLKPIDSWVIGKAISRTLNKKRG